MIDISTYRGERHQARLLGGLAMDDCVRSPARPALLTTLATGHAVYWSRSRQKLWHKGEESGHQQIIAEVRLDCDSDVIILRVQQVGGIACHTGRQSCFYRVLKNGEWQTVDPVIKPPAEIYT